MVEATQLSRRERQIMDILYRLEGASAKEVMANLADPPSYSTVRTLLQKLVEKGHVRISEDGPRYRYHPLVDSAKASQTALQNVVRTFFQGSPLLAVNSLLGMSADDISDEDMAELTALLQRTKESRGSKT